MYLSPNYYPYTREAAIARHKYYLALSRECRKQGKRSAVIHWQSEAAKARNDAQIHSTISSL